MPNVSTPTPQAIGGMAMTAGQNGLIAVAPALPFNNSGVGGFEVLGITAALNVLGQLIKRPKWFKQDEWMIPTLLVLGLALALLLWHDNLGKGILNGAIAVDTAIKNYGALNQGGVMKSAPDGPGG